MSEETTVDHDESRRDFLKKAGLVAGATAWAAPTVQVIRMAGARADTNGSVVEPTTLPPPETGNCAGTVVDAQTGAPIPGATVRLLGGTPSTVTNDNGEFLLTGLPVGPQTLEALATGYQTATTPVTIVANATGDKVIALTAVSVDQITAVLTWGSIPSDLDLHASGPDGSGGTFHVAWYDQNPVDHASLDIDDVTQFGPETITVTISTSGGGQYVPGTYKIWVHDYTNGLGTPQWDESGAQVVFTGPSGQIGVYQVAAAVSAAGGPPIDPDWDLWRVFQFDLDTAGNISNVTALQDFAPGDDGTVL